MIKCYRQLTMVQVKRGRQPVEALTSESAAAIFICLRRNFEPKINTILIKASSPYVLASIVHIEAYVDICVLKLARRYPFSHRRLGPFGGEKDNWLPKHQTSNDAEPGTPPENSDRENPLAKIKDSEFPMFCTIVNRRSFGFELRYKLLMTVVPITRVISLRTR